MTLRLPQNFSSGFGNVTRPNLLEREILAEKAASLGRAGRMMEQALAVLATATTEDPTRPALLRAAADAVHGYFIQRELCGLVDHAGPITHYNIPSEVIARVGAR